MVNLAPELEQRWAIKQHPRHELPTKYPAEVIVFGTKEQAELVVTAMNYRALKYDAYYLEIQA